MANPSNRPAIRVRELYKSISTATHTVNILRGIDFAVPQGQFVAIMGASGSGKSTLFNMLGALQKPTSGKVYIDQVSIAELDANELAWLRCRKIGYIFQNYDLIGVMTCLENVTLPMTFAGLEAEPARERGIELLKRVGLGHRILHKPAELSGGQQQRVAIARALANGPDVVLADEPTANLDQDTGQQMISLLSELRRDLGVTVVSATHDQKMLRASDRVLWLEDGRIVRDGGPGDVDAGTEASR